MNIRWSALAFVLLLAFSAPFAHSLSIGQAANLSEAVGSTVALAEWDRANGGGDEGAAYWLETGVLGQGFFLLPDVDSTSTWFWMHGTWLYGEAGNNPYFYLSEIEGWTYNVLGTAWFVDLATGEWFEIDKGIPSN